MSEIPPKIEVDIYDAYLEGRFYDLADLLDECGQHALATMARRIGDIQADMERNLGTLDDLEVRH